MRVFLVRIILGIGLLALLVHHPISYVLSATALLIWLLPRTYRDRREIGRLRGNDPVKDERAANLESSLRVANAQIEYLHQRLEEANRASQPQSASGHPLYRRVGLDQDCPKWVAEAVRREYRRRLHPDTKPVGQKAEAERRFKEAEQVFSEIWEMRGF